MPDPATAAPDFERRKYELDRAHELELNKFAHALEIERLKVLQYVNGGAFAVSITLAYGLVRTEGTPALLAALAAGCWVLGLAAAAWAAQIQVEAQADFNQAVRLRRNAIEWRQFEQSGEANRSDEAAAAARGLDDPFEIAKALLSCFWTALDLPSSRDAPDPRPGPDDSHPGLDSSTPPSADERIQEIAAKVSPLPDGSPGKCAAEYDAQATAAFQKGVDAKRRVKRSAMHSVRLFLLGSLLLTFALYWAEPEPAAPPARVVVS